MNLANKCLKSRRKVLSKKKHSNWRQIDISNAKISNRKTIRQKKLSLNVLPLDPDQIKDLSSQESDE